MTVTEEPRQATSDLPDANALIKEARQRQRRRWTGGAIVVLAMMVSVVSYAIVSKPSARARHTRTSSPSKTAPAQPGPFVTPKAPYALAVAPNGDLLVVDTGRDQILRRLPSGKFRVVGGSGKHGFSGDGGQAVGAELDIQNDSGIAVAKDGTIYFSDTGNGRVREVLPNGIIKTIVGGGTRTLGQGSMPALSASLSPWGLAIGPNGELYIAANAVYRLGPGGILRWVVGKSVPLPKNYCWDCNPAIQNDFLNTDRLALDGAGDLYVAGGGGWGLYEMTAKGALRFISVFRGEGAFTYGSLASDPDGSVIEADNSGLLARAPDGATTVIHANLNASLGKGNQFTAGYGVAVDAHGDIFTDMDASVFSSVAAIVEVQPNGYVRTLWKLKELG